MNFIGEFRLLAAVIGIASTSALATQQSNYFLGNSLTFNEVHNYVGDKIDMFAQLRGNSHAAGWHWLGGQSLSTLVSNWETNQVASGYSPSDFLTRLPQGGLNNLVMQPSLSSANAETAALVHVANMLPNSDPTKLYVYATWPSRSMDYLPTWNAPYTNPAAAPGWSPNSSYFSSLLTNLRGAEPTREVYMIPAGEVLAEIQRRIDAGTLTGLTSVDDLYGDDLHMSFAGMYAIGLTMYSTLYKDDPRSIGIPAMFQQYVSPSLAVEIENVVRDVVWSDPSVTLTIAGDCNIDDAVNFDDLLTLAQNYGMTTGANWEDGDFNGDASVSFDDLLALARNYQSTDSVPVNSLHSGFRHEWALAQSIVPEPVSLCSAVGLLCIARRTRR